MITGKTLIGMGYKPSKWFGNVIEEANRVGIISKEGIDSLFSKYMVKVDYLEPSSEGKSYFKNIEVSTEAERSNVEQVFSSMDELLKTPVVKGGAVMPDACPTGERGQIPVGGIAVVDNAIIPSMHSADICCSVMMSNLGNVDPKKVLDTAMGVTQFGPGERVGYSNWSKELEDDRELSERILGNYYTKDYYEKALHHLGTQGDGNHFLYVGKLNGDTVVVTHHGSRGFGASVYKKGKRTAENFLKNISPNSLKRNAWIPYSELEGRLYWEALKIVREWTKLNHMTIHQRLALKLKADINDNFWNEHNFVFKDGSDFYHAKGATPLDDKFVPDSTNGLRLIPLNMAEPILIVRGKTNENNLGFAPHGAGRNMSRTAHKKLIVGDPFKEVEHIDVRFYSGTADISELPSAYKNADQVVEQIDKFKLGEVVDRITPFGSIMAGEYSFKRR